MAQQLVVETLDFRGLGYLLMKADNHQFLKDPSGAAS